jgi:hypothetical protein
VTKFRNNADTILGSHYGDSINSRTESLKKFGSLIGLKQPVGQLSFYSHIDCPILHHPDASKDIEDDRFVLTDLDTLFDRKELMLVGDLLHLCTTR